MIEYLILTLVDQPGRIQNAENIIAQHPYFKIYPALDYKNNWDQVKSVFKQNNIVDNKYNKQCGKLGCWASYVKIFSEYIHVKPEYLVVIQDDVAIQQSFKKELNKNYISNDFVIKNTFSARLGPFLAGALFHKNFYDIFFKNIQQTGITKS